MGIASDLAQFLIFVLDRLLAVLREGDLYGASRGLFVWIAEKLTLGWLPDWVFTGLAFVLMAFLVLIVVLTVAPGFTWIMRKVMAHIQSRMGPMYVGPHGLMQPMADGLKLVMKEDIIPARADPFAFRVAPYLALVPVMAAFAVIPFGKGLILADVSTGILFLIAISSAGPLGEILAGWASNNKFAMIGGLRAAALDVSYEIPMILTALAVVLMAGNLSMSAIVEAQQPWWFALMLPLGVAVFLASALARIGVVPLDLPEAESELVAGYFTEYSGMRFGTFFLGVFAGIFLIAALTVTLFFGGWTPLPVFPTQTVFAGFVVVGGTLFLATYLLSRPDARAVGFFAAALSLAGWGLVSWYLVQGLHGGFATLLWQYWIFGAPDWMAIVLTLTGLGLVAASGLYFL
ncbi:MAG TPA: complex I subunit 1 family protein, partial [Candidatus Thermoplasmatota archaeon]|nr:complex I subunit 1 family protein [Candidatus Thermoplasmatota archaeon]